jgi:hypothetical protein
MTVIPSVIVCGYALDKLGYVCLQLGIQKAILNYDH